VPTKRLLRVTTSFTVSPAGSMMKGRPARTDVLWKMRTPAVSLWSFTGEYSRFTMAFRKTYSGPPCTGWALTPAKQLVMRLRNTRTLVSE
jgi:hypothetical protein